jgi:hypothetical protein
LESEILLKLHNIEEERIAKNDKKTAPASALARASGLDVSIHSWPEVAYASLARDL